MVKEIGVGIKMLDIGFNTYYLCDLGIVTYYSVLPLLFFKKKSI